MTRTYVAGGLLASMILLVSVALTAQQRPAAPAHNHATSPSVQAPATASYAMKGAVGPLPPLPRVGFEPNLPMAQITEVYEFAARHPEVLQYVPCYCGCEAGGHKANHDCFVKSRAANGSVTQWDSHGIGCDICLGVGRRAMQMFKSGMSVPAIRASIDKDYGSRYPSQTPTPSPPSAKTAKRP